MCEYITATLPAEADRGALTPVVKRHHLAFTPIPNETVIAQLDLGETYHRVTRSTCDCGTGLGSLAAAADAQAESDRALPRKVRELQSKGWSKTKIDRWLAQHDETRLKRERTAAHHEQWAREQYTAGAEHWLTILREVLESGKTPSVGLLIHWYSGGLESERIEIQKRCQIRISDADLELMLHMQHDILYEFNK
jgi:hypothetical protein